MQVQLLGTGTLVPQASTASAAVMIREGDHVLPLDLGRNSLSRMVEAGVDPLALDTFCITHVHPDHCGELVHLLFGLRYGCRPARERGVRLIGPAGLAALVGDLRRAWRWLSLDIDLTVEELSGGAFEAEGFEVTGVPMHHGETPALGYRVRSPRTGACVAYTGDTGPGSGLIDLARGVDVLVAECAAFEPALESFHLSAKDLADAVEQSGAKVLVVTHLYPWQSRDEVLGTLRHRLGDRVIEARDGLSVDVPSVLAR